VASGGRVISAGKKFKSSGRGIRQLRVINLSKKIPGVPKTKEHRDSKKKKKTKTDRSTKRESRVWEGGMMGILTRGKRAAKSTRVPSPRGGGDGGKLTQEESQDRRNRVSVAEGKIPSSRVT